VSPVHAEQDVPVAVGPVHRREGVVVGHDHVGAGPGLQDAQGLVEEASGDAGVVLEEHGRDLGPGHGGVAQVVLVDQVADLVALQHVVGVAVGAQAQKDAGLEEIQHRATAHGVAHVRLGVVDDHRVRGLQQFNLGPVDVHAVDGQRPRPQDACVMEAVHDPLAEAG